MGKRKQSEAQLANLEKGKATQFSGEAAVRAGQKSAEARKAYRPLKEIIRERVTPEEWDKMVLAMMEKAQRGDAKAFELLRDSVGEKPTEKMELAGAQDLQVNISIRE